MIVIARTSLMIVGDDHAGVMGMHQAGYWLCGHRMLLCQYLSHIWEYRDNTEPVDGLRKGRSQYGQGLPGVIVVIQYQRVATTGFLPAVEVEYAPRQVSIPI